MGWYTFESVQKFAVAAKSTFAYGDGHSRGGSWDNGLDHETAQARALFGDEKLVAEAEKLLAKLDSAVQVPHNEWQPSPFGAYPMVPDYLAGHPESMRHLQPRVSDISPVAIWADMNCCAVFSAKELLDRGVAMLALMMKLQEMRPVQLNVVCALPARSTRLIVKINSQPLDLSTAAFAIGHVAFCRHLMFGYCGEKDGGWCDRIISTEKEFRKYMNIPDKDLAIRGAHGRDPIVSDPIKWLNEMVKKYGVHDELPEDQWVAEAKLGEDEFLKSQGLTRGEGWEA